MTTAKPRPPLAAGKTRAYPVLPLRDIVVFPYMIATLFAGSKKSILALEEGDAVRHLHPARHPEERSKWSMYGTEQHGILLGDPKNYPLRGAR